MSDPRPIGVFDSGIGGLTVWREVRRALPLESTVYLGDDARLPYGPRPQEQVRGFAHEIVELLLALHDVKMIVVACNTASAAALESLRRAYQPGGPPIIGVIEPGAHAAISATRNGRIGVMATTGTVASGAYTRAILSVEPAAEVLPHACPRLVPLVESGETGGPHIEAVLREYLTPLIDAGADTVILGCTHYPLLRPALDHVVDGRLAIVDSARITAAETAALLDARGLRAPDDAAPTHHLYSTGAPDAFRALGRRIFGEDVGPVALARVGAVIN